MTLRPCVVCGEPTGSTRCPEHTPTRARANRENRGYDHTWRRLSERARRLQPWCTDCGDVENLTTDHLPSAWQRMAEHQVIRLQDVAVLCGPCNTRRGSSRPGSTSRTTSTVDNPTQTRRVRLTARGRTPRESVAPPSTEADFGSHTPRGYR